MTNPKAADRSEQPLIDRAFDIADRFMWDLVQSFNIQPKKGGMILFYSGVEHLCRNDASTKYAVEWLIRRGFVSKELNENQIAQLRVIKKPKAR